MSSAWAYFIDFVGSRVDIWCKTGPANLALHGSKVLQETHLSARVFLGPTKATGRTSLVLAVDQLLVFTSNVPEEKAKTK